MIGRSKANQKNIVIVFTTNELGTSDDQPLKDKLVITCQPRLPEMQLLPVAHCFFYTDGVTLACEGSPLVEELSVLEAKGVRPILYQIPLKAYGLNEKVKIGLVGGMGEIITAIWQVDSVITI